MRISLSFKIIGSFALIVLLSLAAAVGTGNRLTRSRYNDFAYQLDLNRAESLSTVLGEWTDEAGTSDMPPPFPPPGALYFLPAQDKSSGFRMMDRMMSMDHMGLDRMVVTDLTGRVLLDTANYGRVRLSPENNESILIRHGEVEVGYIYMGRMIPDSRRPADASFLRSAGMMTWIITGVIFIFAMVLGLILTKHIIGPVKTLNAAAREVEGGDLSVRVPENRSDELGELSRGFNSMTESLESADKQRRRLIADSAHELRTPVSLIRARIEMMEEGIYPMDEANLSALSTESERMTHLVDELKTLANLESPDFVLQREDLSLPDLIQDVVQAAGPAIRRENISVDSGLSGGRPVISGDRVKLHRLLANLCSNALRYAKSRIIIDVRQISETPEWIELTVEDDGPGIPEKDREKVFERYYRVDASRNRSSGGSGLGLAICSEIARAHGGSIEAGVSERLGGAELKVKLPVT